MSMQTHTAASVLASATLFAELVHLLDLSFASDTLTNWLFRRYSHAGYLRRLTYYHRYLLRAALLSDASVIVISKDARSVPPQNKLRIKALAVLIPPAGNTTFESLSTHIRAGMVPLAWHSGFKVISNFLFQFVPRLKAMIAGMYPTSNEHKKYEQWHLLFLATRPDCQGQGLGKRLLLECQRVVADVRLEDNKPGKEASPLYLESSTMSSKRLYNSVGFVDRGEMVYGKCGEGETVTAGKNGKIVGGRIFALTWTP